MDYNSIIKPEAIINQCDDMLVKLDQDNDSIETVLNSFNQFINDSEIQSEAFNALKQRISDYRKHSVRHYKDKFIKISQKIYFVYLFFRVSGTNVSWEE